MDGCIYRTKDGECNIPSRSMECGPLCRSDCPDKHPSNADRIRAMTDEELADFINDTEFGFIARPGMCDVCDHHKIRECLECWLDWLKQEATE